MDRLELLGVIAGVTLCMLCMSVTLLAVTMARAYGRWYRDQSRALAVSRGAVARLERRLESYRRSEAAQLAADAPSDQGGSGPAGGEGA